MLLPTLSSFLFCPAFCAITRPRLYAHKVTLGSSVTECSAKGTSSPDEGWAVAGCGRVILCSREMGSGSHTANSSSPTLIVLSLCP
jgi:hypothetical protein